MSAAEEMMEEAFRRIGKNYGYENVSAEFVSFKQFKVQWHRSYNWISFRISDYMSDAPENIIEDLAETLFARIVGQQGPYSEAMREWVLADEFSMKKRPTFIKRGRYLSRDSVGEHKDLSDSLDRLVQSGLIEPDHNIKAVWNRDTRSDAAGTYSVLMRTAMISSAMDDPDTPDFVLDYAVYHQYLKIRAGAESFGTDDMPLTREDEKKFERYEEAERMLDMLCLAL